MCGADRQLMRMHPPAQGQRPLAGRGAPGLLVQPGERHGAPPRILGLDMGHMARMVAHHVAARRPGGHGEGLPGDVGLGHGQFQRVLALLRTGRGDAILQHGSEAVKKS